MSVLYHLRKIYGLKRPGHLIVCKLQWQSYRSLTLYSPLPTRIESCLNHQLGTTAAADHHSDTVGTEHVTAET